MATAKNRLIPYNESSEQYQFIKNDLIQASKNKMINWIIAYSFRSWTTFVASKLMVPIRREGTHQVLTNPPKQRIPHDKKSKIGKGSNCWNFI